MSGRALNPSRGEFEAVLGGAAVAFDTTLGTIAAIEARHGDDTIVAILNKAVFGRRAADQAALIAAALAAMGSAPEAAQALAARTSVTEAENFVLALMGALGFQISSRAEAGGGRDLPLGRASAGGAGGSSP